MQSNSLLIWNPWFIRIWKFDTLLNILIDISYIVFLAGLIYSARAIWKKNKKLGVAFSVFWILAFSGLGIYNASEDNYALTISGQAMISYVSSNTDKAYSANLMNIKNMLNSSAVSKVSDNSKYIIADGLNTHNFIISNIEKTGSAYGDTLIKLDYIEFNNAPFNTAQFTNYDYEHVSSNNKISEHKAIVLMPDDKVQSLMDLFKSQGDLIDNAMKNVDRNTPFFKQQVLNAINNNENVPNDSKY